MIKIIEVKETITDGRFINNVYDIQKIIQNIINKIEYSNELNYDEYKFLEIIMEKTKISLSKAYEVIK